MPKRIASVVSIAKVRENIKEAVRHAVELTGGLDLIVPPGSTVLIKPNVGKALQSGSGNVTDACVTEAVTRMVLERDPDQVIIGEGSAVGYDIPGCRDTMHCFEVSGTTDVARRLGVELVDLNRDECVEVQVEKAFVKHTFKVARTAWEADVIINLPVIKTHVRTGITCGLKNMKGVLPGNEKKLSHRVGLDRAIVDLNRVMKPSFTVVDAVVGMEGVHVYPEDCVPLGLIVSGADVVAVDTVCATLIGFDVNQIQHLRLAAQEGLGLADLGEIEVRGEELARVSRRFIPYQEAAQDRFGAATIIEKNACTGCMGEMVGMFIYLGKAGFAYRLDNLTLVLGEIDELPPLRGHPVVIGKCVRVHRDVGIFVPGCPPLDLTIVDGVCEALGIDRVAVQRSIEELHGF